MSRQVQCEGCGAPMSPGKDARTLECAYCGGKVQVALDAQQIATGLAPDLTDVDGFLARLAGTLAGALGEQLRMQSDGGRVVSLEVTLDPDVFLARRERHGVVAQHRKLVRGVALKTATHPLDRWFELLTASLARHAAENARLAGALAKLRKD